MGDRCWLQVTVHRNHVDAFWEAVGDEPKYNNPTMDEWGNSTYEVEEANYGWYDQLDAAAAAGCIFEGQHGPGGEYGPAAFACDGQGLCHNVDCDHESTPVVRCGEDGVDQRDLVVVQNYWRVFNCARELLERTGAVELRRIVDDGQGNDQDQGAGGDEEVGQ